VENNPNFSFQINLGGVSAASGGGSKLVTGFYTGKITDCYHRKASTGRDMIEFKFEVNDGSFQGITRTFRINVPTGPADGVAPFWRAAFESVGYTGTQIDGAGNINVSRDIFVGKPGHIHYTEGVDGGFDQTNLIRPEDYQLGKQADMAAAAAVNAAVQAPVQAQGLGGGLNGGNAPVQAQGLDGGLGQTLDGGLGQTAAPMSSNSLLQKLGA
jgi:hypothetical protein